MCHYRGMGGRGCGSARHSCRRREGWHCCWVLPIINPQLANDVYEVQTHLGCPPDIVIVERLNVLQTGDATASTPPLFVSDYFDFSVYVDAEEADIEQWYLERFFALRETTFRDPNSHFHQYASLADDATVATARQL